MQKLSFYNSAVRLPSLMLFIFLTVIGQNAAATCTVNETDEGHTLLVEAGSKKIAILGWEHPNEVALKRRVDQFNKFLDQQKRTCDDYADLVGAALIKEPGAVNSAVATYHRMLTVPFVNSRFTLGSEISQKEMDQRQVLDDKGQPKDFFNLQNIKATFEILSQAGVDCPDIEPEIGNYALFLLNPEYAFWADAIGSKAPLNIQGFDDYEARMEVLQNSSAEDRTFDPKQHDLPVATRFILAGLAKRYHENLEAPSDSAIENAIAPIKDSQMSFKVAGYLRAMQLITDTLQRRNQKIVENIMDTPGNVIMNVGDDHIRGLKTEFERMCVNMTKQSPALIPTKVQVKQITKDPAG